MSSISRIFLIDKMHKHSGVKVNYLFESQLKFNDLKINAIYCKICNIYMCPQKLYEHDYKNKIDNRFFKILKDNDFIHDTCYEEEVFDGIKINKDSSFSLEHLNHKIKSIMLKYRDVELKVKYCEECNCYGVDDEQYDSIKNKENLKKIREEDIIILNNQKNYDLRKNFKENHSEHKIINRIVKLGEKKFFTNYCIDCDMYELSETLFNEYFSDDYNGTIVKDKVIEYFEPRDKTIEFLVRINTFKCQAKGHEIEEIRAVVNVFDKKTKSVKEIEITAFYCRQCRLYFLYESEYKTLLHYGIPTCPIHEENKYFIDDMGFETYNTMSLLRQFGYNVNANENLSTLKRQNIIRMVIQNGIMTKSAVLSHLNYLVNSRKNIANMNNAIKKWNEDIEYTRNLPISNIPKVNIGAFRKIKYEKNINRFKG